MKKGLNVTECQIEIVDEVNCKIHGLDIKTRRKCIDKLKFRLPNAQFLPSVKLGRWDGTEAFFSVGGGTQINLLDRVIPLIDEAGYTIDIVDNRQSYDFNIPQIDANYLSDISFPDDHAVAPGKPIVLRDHQVTAINEFLGNLQGIQSLPTSSGKTIITACLSKLIQPYGRSIVIVPNTDLVEQTREDYELIGLDVGVYHGNEKNWNKTHTICTWQSLNVLLQNTRNDVTEDGFTIQEFVDNVSGLIIDECLHPDTLIRTPSGMRKISDLSPGDVVYSYDEDKKIIIEDSIVKVHENLVVSSSEDMYELEFDNGTTIQITGNHKILTEDRGWIRADQLTENDEIIDFDTNTRNDLEKLYEANKAD